MRTIQPGRIVRTVEIVDGLPAGAVARVLGPTPGNPRAVNIQVAPGTLHVGGTLFDGHNADGMCRTRGWTVPRTALKLTRHAVANAREFREKYAQ